MVVVVEMRWAECANCGAKKMVGTVKTPDEIFFCGSKCQREGKKWVEKHPRPDVGSRSTRARSERQVASITGQVGGTVVRGSGAIRGLPGDRLLGEFMVEEKATDGRQYTLAQETWEKLVGEAALVGKDSLLILDLGPYRIAMVPWDQLRSRLEDKF
jgi:hypothetical protein